MKLFDSQNLGIIQNIDRFCGTSITTYPIKNKVADSNDSLDWYMDLAEKASSNWNNDDSNNTTPPIDTQNIVSGTNRYKLSAFTEEIEEILKIEVDDGTGVCKALFPETLDSFGGVVGSDSGHISWINNGSFDDIYINAPSGIPTAYIKYGDFIYLNRKPNYNATSGLKIYFNRPATKFLFYPVVANTDNTLTATAHGLVANDTVLFETDGTIPTGLTADTLYYVISSGLTSSVFKVSTTLGGSEVDITNAQSSSNHFFLKLNKEPGIISSHHPMIYKKASEIYMSANNANGVYNSRLSTIMGELNKDEVKILSYFARRDKDVRKRLRAAMQNNH